LAAGVQEAQARTAADAQLLEAERDQAHRDLKDLFVQAQVQQNVLSLLRKNNLPAAKQVLELTASDYRAGNAGVDYLSLVSAWRDQLQVELQIAQIEAELAKTLASLERAVGCQINEHPPDLKNSDAAGKPGAEPPVSVPAPQPAASPFSHPVILEEPSP
jgi:hypothetical protein